MQQTPSLARRRTACTHLTMKRLYGLYECDVCHYPSQFGWVYICTQDDPDPEHYSVNPTRLQTEKDPFRISLGLTDADHRNDDQEPSPELSLWIQRAVNDGHYTAEQVEILIDQRRNVINKANAARRGPEGSKLPKNCGRGPSSSLQVKSSGETAGKSPVRYSTVTSEPLHDIQRGSQLEENAIPICRFRACQACRPTFRDRTWRRFEDVFEKDAASILAAEEQDAFECRPVGRASVMRNIGLRSPVLTPSISRGRSRHRPSGGSSESRDHGDTRSEQHGRESAADTGLGLSKDLMKRILEKMEKKPSGTDGQHDQGKSESAPLRIDYAHWPKRTKLDIHEEMMSLGETDDDEEEEEEQEEGEEGDDGSAQFSEGLSIDSANADTGEAGVADGVAVKEESVDLGMPDIIMSI